MAEVSPVTLAQCRVPRPYTAWAEVSPGVTLSANVELSTGLHTGSAFRGLSLSLCGVGVGQAGHTPAGSWGEHTLPCKPPAESDSAHPQLKTPDGHSAVAQSCPPQALRHQPAGITGQCDGTEGAGPSLPAGFLPP